MKPYSTISKFFATSLLLLGFVATTSFSEGPDKLPSFSLEDLEGTIHTSDEFKGKIVVLDFWATWCATCEESIPFLVELQKKYADQNVKIVGISLDKGSSRKVKRFVKKKDVQYQILRDKKNTQADVFKYKGIPSVYLFDAEGNLVLGMPGYSPDREKDLEVAIEKLLKAK